MTTVATSNQQTNVWQYKCFVEWVKTVLFAELLDSGARVALLGGALGADTGKLQRAHVDSVTVVDDAAPLAAAEERWRSKGEPFKCAHVVGAPHLAAHWRTRVPDARQLDAVFAFDALDLVPTDESALDAWLAATAALLKPGGRLAGVCADSAQLWSRAQKALIAEAATAGTGGGAGTGVLSSDLFDLSFALGLDSFPRFGARYVLTLHEGTAIRPDAVPANELHRSLVHFGSLIRLALTHGLHFVEATNFLDFYEEHKRTHQAALKQCGVLAGGKTKIEQADLIGLFTTFVFVKGG